MTRFIFVTGGVTSSLGKGIASSALGALLQSRGFSVCLRKLDPYLNVDPGTMNPYQHGEVFVTEDGAETDLDLGHYERFTGKPCTTHDYTTTGQIYSRVIANERRGDYLGATVQVVPHITDEIKRLIQAQTDAYDFVLCEIGGTVGDIEGLPYLEAIRQLRYDLGRSRTVFIHLTLLPYIATAGELKTKPTQHSVKALLSLGIQADLLLCRSATLIPESTKEKLSLFCNVSRNNVIAALDAKNIYDVPLQYHQEGFDAQVCEFFGLDPAQHPPRLEAWEKVRCTFSALKKTVNIGIVGKYTILADAYKSLQEAIIHAGVFHQVKVNIRLINSEENPEDLLMAFQDLEGIVVAGGFGERGTPGKILAIQYARESKKPFLGICFGMQLAVIEACRNQLGWGEASSSEFGPTNRPVIGLVKEWIKEGRIEFRSQESHKGGTMRLGNYPCVLEEGSCAHKVYGQHHIYERHRHRYEVDREYASDLASVGLFISGYSPDGMLPEVIERRDHPWFLATQAHPEFNSSLFSPHPLFKGLVGQALQVLSSVD